MNIASFEPGIHGPRKSSQIQNNLETLCDIPDVPILIFYASKVAILVELVTTQKLIQKEIMKIIPFDFWIHLLVLQLYSNPYLHRYLHQAEACLDLQNLEVFHLMLISFGHLHLFCHLIYLLLRPSVLQFQLTSVHHLKL